MGVIETAKNSISAFDNILKLQDKIGTEIQTLGSRSNNAQTVINYLFKRPIIDAQKVKKTHQSFISSSLYINR